MALMVPFLWGVESTSAEPPWTPSTGRAQLGRSIGRPEVSLLEKGDEITAVDVRPPHGRCYAETMNEAS